MFIIQGVYTLHFKKRKTKKILLAVGAVATALLIVSLTILVLSSGLLSGGNNGRYALPSGNIKGIVLPTESTSAIAGVVGEEQQKQFIDEFVNFAANGNLNSVFVDYMQTDTETVTIFGRDSKIKTMQSIAVNDKFFDKFDAMEYLVNSAAQKGLNVYALYDMPPAEDTTITKNANSTMKKYAISGVFYKNEVAQGFGTLASSQGDTVAYTSAEVWTQPQNVFLHTVSEEYNGMVISDYDTAALLPNEYALMISAMQNDSGVPTLLGYDVPAQLNVTYPAENQIIYTSTCYVMGTSDPTLPLTLNGENVERIGNTGAFGVLVELEQGDNDLIFEQGNNVLAYLVTRGGYSSSSSSGSSSSSSSSSDNTSSVEPGTYVAVSGWIASLLYEPSSDANINETVRLGATAKVVDSVRTVRNNKYTWAYELSSGDYILAYNTQYLGTQVETPTFTSASAQVIDDGKGELLTFTGAGTPMAYSNIVENTLSVKMYDVNVDANFAVSGSEMVTSTTVNVMDDGAHEIIFTFDDTLFGHSVEYENGVMQIYFKKTPQINTQNQNTPLLGVSVLLDAGHGDADTGALGVVGVAGPTEKDANLAVSIAAKYRLEQLGATVHMVRQDDTFYELAERNALITQLRPDFFISVHHNSVNLTVDANSISGVECYYFYNEAQPLAQTLVQEIVTATGREERGAHWGYYYVARNTMCPSVLLECGFMINPKEYEEIVNEQDIWEVGDAIARSILQQVISVN